ncbi:MAG: hypothetical protein ABIG29_01730 [Candidatus Nealsonbacteria bacterium]
MARIEFVQLEQGSFLRKIQRKTGFSCQKMASICGVSRRSFSDWKNGNCLISLSAFERLIKISNINRPFVRILPDYWHIKEASRKGAFARNAIYGNPATSDGRSRGGKTTCDKFSSNPELAKKLGFKIRKNIHRPGKSCDLAELVGILLGDGGITDYQVKVTQNKEADKDYSPYIVRLFKHLFGLDSTIRDDKLEKTRDIIVSSVSLVEYLLGLGLKNGNKIINQVDIPSWVKISDKFKKACLRGLIDTDGCFYVDRHKIKNKDYFNPGLIFTAYSLPLFSSAKGIFVSLGYHPTGKKRNLYLRKEDEIIRYFREIGSSNPKHIAKFRGFLKEHRGGRFN